ncbi:MAG: dehydrogenase [Paucimonas sp.]|nr:dehydrogenase [Paucimonas sp.]
MSVLVIYAHPHPHRSRANQQLAKAAASLPGVEVLDLYETYPDFHIDVAAEQQRVGAASLLVLQHPIYWYGMPALLKQWIDVVFERGWAYGEGGTALAGKDFLLAVTTGGPQDAYRPAAEHGYEFPSFLPPFRQTAEFCGMRWHAPLVLHDAHGASDAQMAAHVAQYRHILASYPDWPPSAESGLA